MQLPIYFISDIHFLLQPSNNEDAKKKKLFLFLESVKKSKGSLIINGDLFDFYFEYPHVIPKAYFDVYQIISELTNSGITVHYVLGNHDYWTQDFISDSLNMIVHKNDIDFEINGKKFHVTHGDGLLTWERGYRYVKKILHSRFTIWMFRWLHPTIGYGLAEWIASRSRHFEHSKEHNDRVRNELVRIATPIINSGTDYFITGHYHQHTDEKIGEGRLIILGEWIKTFTYAMFDGKELFLKKSN
jgi:UDP-2,3-diacylglucosamine hydrolase